jgi:hypothetical protein
MEYDMKRMTRKGVIVTGAVAAAAVIGGGAAFAYWTTNGSDTGTAGAATGVAAVGITQTSALSGLYPGGPAQNIVVDLTNGDTIPVSLESLTAALDGTSDEANCPAAANFSVSANPSLSFPLEVGAGATVQVITVGTIQMQNLATNQDDCKGVTVNLAYAAG